MPLKGTLKENYARMINPSIQINEDNVDEAGKDVSSFTDGEPIDDLKVDQFGRELAAKCGWNGVYIVKAFLEALTDANFHSLRKRLGPIITREFNSDNGDEYMYKFE